MGSIWGTTPSDIWAVEVNRLQPGVYHYDGDEWRESEFPMDSVATPREVFGTTSGDVYVYAERLDDEFYAVFRHDADGWRDVSGSIVYAAAPVQFTDNESDLLATSGSCVTRFVDGAWVPLDCAVSDELASDAEGTAVAASQGFGHRLKRVQLTCDDIPNDCGDRECGLSPSGYHHCGSCSDGDPCTSDVCVGGECSFQPVDDCGDRDCGDSPSGCRSCGVCSQGDVCVAGHCAGIAWTTISGGSFQMGAAGLTDDEVPVHSVTVSTFEMATTEVTQAQWEIVFGNNPSESVGDERVPVSRVNWWEAVAFCNALSDAAGIERCYTLSGCLGTAGEDMECTGVTFAGVGCQGYRLPTEAEWEYAARSEGQDISFPWGDAEPNCGRAVMHEPESGDGCGSGSPWPVCAKSPLGDSEQGLCDMAGNVSEWVWDWYGDYGSASQDDPTGPVTGAVRVTRGGDCRNNAYDEELRAAGREEESPDNVGSYLGFRPARSLP